MNCQVPAWLTFAHKTSPAICTCFPLPRTVVMENITGKKRKGKKKIPLFHLHQKTTHSIKWTATLTCCKVLCWSTKSDTSLHMHDESNLHGCAALYLIHLNSIWLLHTKIGPQNTSDNINMHTGYPARMAGEPPVLHHGSMHQSERALLHCTAATRGDVSRC